MQTRPRIPIVPSLLIRLSAIPVAGITREVVALLGTVAGDLYMHAALHKGTLGLGGERVLAAVDVAEVVVHFLAWLDLVLGASVQGVLELGVRHLFVSIGVDEERLAGELDGCAAAGEDSVGFRVWDAAGERGDGVVWSGGGGELAFLDGEDVHGEGAVVDDACAVGCESSGEKGGERRGEREEAEVTHSGVVEANWLSFLPIPDSQ